MSDFASHCLPNLLHDSSCGILAFDPAGLCRFANSISVRLLGASDPEGKSLDELFHAFPDILRACQVCLNDGHRGFQLGGGELWFNANANADGLLLVITDAVANKWSRELHDSTGPLIAAIRLQLQRASNSVSSGKEDLLWLDVLLRELELGLRDLYRSLRNTSRGLGVALEELCQLLGTAAPATLSCFVPPHPVSLSEGLQHDLYRIAQELLHNAIQHAAARNITLQLLDHADSLVLMVEDDGVGSAPITRSKGGLQHIRERVNSLGGTFLWDSLPGKGTSATVEIPFFREPGNPL